MTVRGNIKIANISLLFPQSVTPAPPQCALSLISVTKLYKFPAPGTRVVVADTSPCEMTDVRTHHPVKLMYRTGVLTNNV